MLIPSVSDPETSQIPWWHCARGPSCRLPCCTPSCLANLWLCLGCYWCPTAPSSPITFLSLLFFPTASILSCTLLSLLAGDETLCWPQANTFVPPVFLRLNGLFLQACTLEMCHRGLPPFHQKLNGHAGGGRDKFSTEDKLDEAVGSAQTTHLNGGTLRILKFN